MAQELKSLVYCSPTSRRCNDVSCPAGPDRQCTCSFVCRSRDSCDVVLRVDFVSVDHCPICSGHQLLVRSVLRPTVGVHESIDVPFDVSIAVVKQQSGSRILARGGFVSPVRFDRGSTPIFVEESVSTEVFGRLAASHRLVSRERP
jgi:hypothetical protein